MRLPTLTLFVFFCNFVNSADTYKILVYSSLYGHSHIKFLAAVADTLTDAGHDVTVFMPVIDENQRDKTALKSTKKQVFIEADEYVKEKMKETRQFLTNLWTVNATDPIGMLMSPNVLVELFGVQCEKVMRSKEILNQLRLKNFDLAITEPFDSCGYGIIEYLQISAHVSVLSASRMDHVSSILGQPIAPSYVPSTQSVSGDRMNMLERITNFLHFLAGKTMFSDIGDFEAESAKKILGIERHWRELLPESSFILTNNIPILDFAAPTFDKIVPIGGITVNTNRKSMQVSEPWDTMMNMRKKNVLISFGSSIRSMDMPDKFKQSFLDLFEAVRDTTFLWKYENIADRKLTCGVLNVNRGEWLPQNEILADSRLNAFITHGGAASILEVAMMGVSDH